jgi:hypothetical protein
VGRKGRGMEREEEWPWCGVIFILDGAIRTVGNPVFNF